VKDDKDVTSMQIEIEVKKKLEVLKKEHQLISISAVVKRLLAKTNNKI